VCIRKLSCWTLIYYDPKMPVCVRARVCLVSHLSFKLWQYMYILPGIRHSFLVEYITFIKGVCRSLVTPRAILLVLPGWCLLAHTTYMILWRSLHTLDGIQCHVTCTYKHGILYTRTNLTFLKYQITFQCGVPIHPGRINGALTDRLCPEYVQNTVPAQLFCSEICLFRTGNDHTCCLN
jgi:hypothetical protein